MKGYFTRSGKFRSKPGSIVVSDEDVKAKTVFDVNDDNAKYFVESGAFVAGNVAKADFSEDEKKPAAKKTAAKKTAEEK